MPDLRSCSFDELRSFVASYPRPLEVDKTYISEPPLITYNDFSLGNWPDSVVASYHPFGGDPKDLWAEVPCGFRIASAPATV